MRNEEGGDGQRGNDDREWKSGIGTVCGPPTLSPPPSFSRFAKADGGRNSN